MNSEMDAINYALASYVQNPRSGNGQLLDLSSFEVKKFGMCATEKLEG